MGMGDINRVARLYLKELGMNVDSKRVECTLIAARKSKSDSKIVINISDWSEVTKPVIVPKQVVEEVEYAKDDDEDDLEDDFQDTSKEVVAPKKLFG